MKTYQAKFIRAGLRKRIRNFETCARNMEMISVHKVEKQVKIGYSYILAKKSLFEFIKRIK